MELETKLKYLENKSEQLEKENNYLHVRAFVVVK